MGREEDLLRIAKKLDKMVSRSQKNLEGALDLLKELNSYSMTIQLLQSTRIGVTVNAVRKHCSDEEVVAMAKILIKNWKRLLDSSVPQKEEKEKERQTEKKEKERRIELSGWKPVEESKEVCRRSAQKCKERDFPSLKAFKLCPPSKKHSSDLKQDRKLSVPATKSDSHMTLTKSHSLDSRSDRRDSTDSNPFPAVAKRSKAERRDSSDSRSSSCISSPSSSSPVKRQSTERRHSTSSNPAASPAGSRKNSSDEREERQNDIKSKAEAAKTPSSPSSPSFSPTICFLSTCHLTGDSIRDKCIEMLSAALKHGDDYKQFGSNCDQVASEIEDHIYQELKATDMKYRNRVRSRISNLKDPKNPNLRKNVLCGSISAERIARMTSEEMASDELKELRNAMTQEAIREHQMAKTGGTQTDFFQCNKCKKKNCTYNQVQTRSADEPMTTFVLCNECGNRWKFC